MDNPKIDYEKELSEKDQIITKYKQEITDLQKKIEDLEKKMADDLQKNDDQNTNLINESTQEKIQDFNNQSNEIDITNKNDAAISELEDKLYQSEQETKRLEKVMAKLEESLEFEKMENKKYFRESEILTEELNNNNEILRQSEEKNALFRQKFRDPNLQFSKINEQIKESLNFQPNIDITEGLKGEVMKIMEDKDKIRKEIEISNFVQFQSLNNGENNLIPANSNEKEKNDAFEEIKSVLNNSLKVINNGNSLLFSDIQIECNKLEEKIFLLQSDKDQLIKNHEAELVEKNEEIINLNQEILSQKKDVEIIIPYSSKKVSQIY